MIKKLRIKFIVLSMVAVFVLIAIIVAGMNIVNYRSVVREAEDTLTYLAKNKGTFPDMKPDGLMPGEAFFSQDEQPYAPGQDSFAEDFDETDDEMDPDDLDDPDDIREEFGPGGMLPSGMSPETPYESRFFSVLLSEDGTVILES